MLILTHSQVRDLLPMRDCMSAVGEVLADLARGKGVQPLRAGFLRPDRRGVLVWMPGALAAGEVFGIKILSVVDDASALGVDSHQGAVLVFDPTNGAPLALLEAGAVTAVRTAAASAVATDLLARRDATTLAILGAGIQARSHLEAMLEVRAIEQVRVWSRSPDTVRALATEQAALHGLPVDAAATVAEAVAGAHIVCTTTSSREPVLPGVLLGPGMHVNAVGASIPSRRELDSEAVRRSTLFTDRRESLEHEAGEYRVALAEGTIGKDHVKAELGEILLGKHPGRSSDHEITLFRSLGLAVEDLAACRLVYQRALERGVGTRVDLEA